MATEYSFDVVSQVDMHMVEDAVNVAVKEIMNRYDFKDTKSVIELDAKAAEIKLSSCDDFRIRALFDVLLTRLSKRGLPLKNFVPGKMESALGDTVRQTVKIQQGIPSEKAKELSKLIKDSKLKATASIKGEELRVVSRSKDELQQVIALIKGRDFGLDLQFTNYR
ncbi:MAG: YajQ family cyclic di-GMP-binding protein [Elusimicrobiaceae bacterium]